ncbi:MAG TPA: PLD nuclease N-terminal domain-containing protein [Blastocatellia bacterium]|nr:PLD nuclease N-terminal domain-containing protein [Blastocatellia bacterium]
MEMSEIGQLIAILSVGLIKLVWIWMLIDCAMNEPPGSDKVLWILLMVFTGCIGGLIYFYVRRPRRIKKFDR